MLELFSKVVLSSKNFARYHRCIQSYVQCPTWSFYENIANSQKITKKLDDVSQCFKYASGCFVYN